MTDQNNGHGPTQERKTGALVFGSNDGKGMGSVANHASINTSTGDAANILVYQQEARVKKQLRAVKEGRNRLEKDLSDANNELATSVNDIGTSFNKHNQASFKTLVKNLNASDNNTIGLLNTLMTIKPDEQKFNGKLTCEFHFDGEHKSINIEMHAEIDFVRRQNLAEDSTSPTRMPIPMPVTISFNVEQMSDILTAHPTLFPDDFDSRVNKTLTLLKKAHKCKDALSSLNDEISRLNQLLSEIPSLERAARAKISEGQLKQSGQEEILKLLTDSGNELASDLLGSDSDFLDDNGKFRLPVVNEAD